MMLWEEVHHQRVYYGWNDVGPGILAVGTYVYKVEDQGNYWARQDAGSGVSQLIHHFPPP